MPVDGPPPMSVSIGGAKDIGGVAIEIARRGTLRFSLGIEK